MLMNPVELLVLTLESEAVEEAVEVKLPPVVLLEDEELLEDESEIEEVLVVSGSRVVEEYVIGGVEVETVVLVGVEE